MPQLKDKRGLSVTVADEAARDALDALIDAYVGFRVDTGDRLRAAMKGDAEAPLVQAAAGYIYHLMVLKPLLERAAAASEKATTLAEEKGDRREQLHAEALAAWTAGDLRKAVRLLETILMSWPHDIMALKLAHYLHFYLGDIAEHRDSVARVLPAWRPDMPGYAAVLGMRAFGLEEAGDYAAAERFGRRAVELDPSDSWSVHAVAHVLEMQGRSREGIAWIDGGSADWDGKVHNFANHVWWHKALYHLDLDEHDAVLELYDTRFRKEETEDGLDIANAAAMLMRLKTRDVACGDRWDRLAEVAARKATDHILPFNDLHMLLALSGAGQNDRSAAAATALAARSTADAWTPVYRDVAGPMARGIAAYGAGDYGQTVRELAPVRYQWRAIGGSHAPRDVFQQLLIDAAMRDEQWRLAQALLAERTALFPRNADAGRRAARASNALGQTERAKTEAAEAARLAAA